MRRRQWATAAPACLALLVGSAGAAAGDDTVGDDTVGDGAHLLEVPEELSDREPYAPEGWEGDVRDDPAASLAAARAAEESFELDSALTHYLAGCSSTPAAEAEAAAWEECCAGAIVVAFGAGRAAELDQALTSLLSRRPHHDLGSGRFPPAIAERAAVVRSRLGSGSLRLEGGAASVLLDGQAVGVTPIRTALPAGLHRVVCNGWSRAVQVPRNAELQLACPPPAELPRAHPGLVRLRDAGVLWMSVDGEGVGMDPGLWVFDTRDSPIGVLVHDDDAGARTWAEAAKRMR